MGEYKPVLTAVENGKGCLDVDTVKGCAHAADVLNGCYGACYAVKTARFRGIDFSRPVVRRIHGSAHARRIEHAVRNAPQGFFRVGTMGDPSYAWGHTLRIIEWLAPLAMPVIVTKHWRTLDDGDVCRLVECGAVLKKFFEGLRG